MATKEPMRRILFFPPSNEAHVLKALSKFIEENRVNCDIEVKRGHEWCVLRARGYERAMQRLDDWAAGFSAAAEY